MANFSKGWTGEETELLKSKYGSIPNIDLAKEMGRTKQAIQHRAHRLGITTFKVAVFKNCEDCGAKLSRSSCYKATASRCFPCSMKNHSRDGHHNWKGGVSSLRSLVHLLLKPLWVDPIFKRDQYTCRFCRKTGGNLNAHHIYPYRKIRDRIIKSNPKINLRTFDGRKKMALLVVEAHELQYGITLCEPCHVKVHDETRGELLGTPFNKDNQQPSRSNVIQIVDRKVHRLTGEDITTDKPDTSTAHLFSTGEDIVGACK